MTFTATVIMKRVGIYLRVSTGGQTTENQRRELGAVAARSSWQVVDVYEDAGISGAKGRDKRPGFDRLLKDATGRKINMIAAWSVDRLGRSLQDLVGFLTELRALGCDLYLHQQALDTSTPSGRAMFQMLGVFAEFERGIIRERVNAGLARARERATKLGRRPVKSSVEARIRELRADSMGTLKIGRTLGVGTSVVQRVLSGRGAQLLDGGPAVPADDLRQARELALLICSSEDAIDTFIAHCEVAARDLLMPHGDAVIVLSTVLRIKRTLDGAEIDKIISGLQASKALAMERHRRADWRKRELSANRFAAKFGHVDDGAAPHPAHNQMT